MINMPQISNPNPKLRTDPGIYHLSHRIPGPVPILGGSTPGLRVDAIGTGLPQTFSDDGADYRIGIDSPGPGQMEIFIILDPPPDHLHSK